MTSVLATLMSSKLASSPVMKIWVSPVPMFTCRACKKMVKNRDYLMTFDDDAHIEKTRLVRGLDPLHLLLPPVDDPTLGLPLRESATLLILRPHIDPSLLPV